ncbi:hypothetical protein ABT369_54160 [Dactylosporangium sp. NPDC000244]|uniref:hypothetical protein n=1 Tax=Dactylosporangium sp. NPDC000244 TaxID=3154365 RepID=UPI0033310926
MNCKTQVALAAGIGYLLGRQRKLRWGLLLAAAAASGRLRPGSLLDHGARALKATPELGKLGEMGGPLVAATKDAARAAVTDRIGSISDRLRERTETLKGRAVPEPEEEAEEAPERGRRRAGGARRARPRAEREEEPEEDEYEEEDEDEGADEDEREEEDESEDLVRAGRRRGGRPPVRRRREG